VLVPFSQNACRSILTPFPSGYEDGWDSCREFFDFGDPVHLTVGETANSEVPVQLNLYNNYEQNLHDNRKGHPALDRLL
jgi:hypothetical protein